MKRRAGARRAAARQNADTGPDRSLREITSRRRFLKLITAGSASLLAGSASGARSIAATAPARSRDSSRPLPRVVRVEIESQKQYLAKALKAIREYPLAAGSDMAFTFKPLGPRRRSSERGRAREGSKPR